MGQGAAADPDAARRADQQEEAEGAQTEAPPTGQIC